MNEWASVVSTRSEHASPAILPRAMVIIIGDWSLFPSLIGSCRIFLLTADPKKEQRRRKGKNYNGPSAAASGAHRAPPLSLLLVYRFLRDSFVNGRVRVSWVARED